MSNANANEMLTIELDTALDDKAYWQWEHEMRTNFAIETRLVQENGPAGGNAVIEYKGERDELERMLIEHFDADGQSGESVAFYLGEER